MYILYFLLIVIYFAVTAALDARETKKLTNAPITEKVRCKWYIGEILWGWGAAAAVFIMCLLADISPEEIGLRRISFNYPVWFNTITLALCGFLIVVLLYQMVSYSVSAKYRKAVKAKFASDADKSHPDHITSDLVIPRSKKEKVVFFWLSLTAGIGEEIVTRGFLFFLLQTIFPDLPVVLVVLIAGAIFGIAHSYQGLQGVIKTGIIGVLLGCLLLVTGSIIPGMLLHFLVDFSNVFLLSEE